MGAFLGLVFGLGALLIWRGARGMPAESGTQRVSWQVRRGEMLRRAGLEGVGPLQLLAAQVVAGVISFLAVALLTRTLVVALFFAVFGFLAPLVLVRRMHRRRLVALREVWPEAIDSLASAVRAGMSLPEGLAALAVRGPAELRAPFERFGARYRVGGRFEDSLDALKDDLADPVGDRVCETIRVARQVGGNDLGTVLRTLSEILRADARTRAELETRQGWVVNAARLAVAAPWVVLLLLGTQSSTISSYDSAGGTVLLAAGAAVCLLAYRIMLRIGRLPEDQRVLR